MQRSIYIRPLGIYAARADVPPAETPREIWGGLPLAGGPLAFSALEVLERENSWLRGAFLWKWFVGPAPGANFVLDAPHTRAVLAEFWAR